MPSQVWRFLPFAILVSYVIAVAIRLRIHGRRFGSHPLVLFQAHRRENLLQLGAPVMPLVLVVQSFRAAIEPSMIAASPIAWVLGLGLLIAGFAIFDAARREMGASLRIGIDPQAKPGLVTSGIFRVTRNPIYVGMAASLAGLALIVPNWLSIAAVFGFMILISVQTREEERYLAEKYGQDFYRYAARVGRFLPRLGRLRN